MSTPTTGAAVALVLAIVPSDMPTAVQLRDEAGRLFARRFDPACNDLETPWAVDAGDDRAKAGLLALRHFGCEAFIDFEIRREGAWFHAHAHVLADVRALDRVVTPADVSRWAPQGGPRIGRVRRAVALICRQMPPRLPAMLVVRDETGRTFERWSEGDQWMRLLSGPTEGTAARGFACGAGLFVSAHLSREMGMVMGKLHCIAPVDRIESHVAAALADPARN